MSDARSAVQSGSGLPGFGAALATEPFAPGVPGDAIDAAAVLVGSTAGSFPCAEAPFAAPLRLADAMGAGTALATAPAFAGSPLDPGAAVEDPEVAVATIVVRLRDRMSQAALPTPRSVKMPAMTNGELQRRGWSDGKSGPCANEA